MPIPWAPQFTYLGMSIKSSAKFAIDLKPGRANFYRAFNSLYSKIYRANEFLIVSLVKSFCLPVFMFSLSAIDLNNSSLTSIDNLMYNAFGKIFKTFNHNILNSCMYYLNCWLPRHEYYNRRITFLNNLVKIDNSILKIWSTFNAHELNDLCSLLNIDQLSNARSNIWKNFENSYFQI